jgi:hypothetical protein
MSTETMICYWIGEALPCLRLDAMPAYVNVVPLAFVNINDNYELDFAFLCQTYAQADIQGWIKKVRANGTKVLFSIQDPKLGQIPDPKAFVTNVLQNVMKWGVDGVDLDYEPDPWISSQGLLDVADELRTRLGTGTLLTAAIYDAWKQDLDFMGKFAKHLDFVTTMDYSPYTGLDDTKGLINTYADYVPPGKLAIGVSCMRPETGRFTPLEDVKELCRWELAAGQKKGVMLYTFSYDVKSRPSGGTGLPDGTFTETIHECLP